MSQTELAARAGMAQSEISKLEAGSRTATDETVARLGDALSYPRSLFYTVIRPLALGHAAVYHRKRQSLSTRALTRLHAIINITRFHAAVLDGNYKFPSDNSIFSWAHLRWKQADECARSLRILLRLSKGPITDLERLVEGAGCIIVLRELFAHEADAVSQCVADEPPIILLNAAMPGDRQRFTLAHELGHLILHRDFDVAGRDLEQEANSFAPEFLMPRDEIASELTKLSVVRLAQLKSKWNVSMAALLKRAGDIGVITPWQSQVLWRQMSALGYRRTEPVEVPRLPRHSLWIHRASSYHCSGLGWSVGRLADELCLLDEECLSPYLESGAH